MQLISVYADKFPDKIVQNPLDAILSNLIWKTITLNECFLR